MDFAYRLLAALRPRRLVCSWPRYEWWPEDRAASATGLVLQRSSPGWRGSGLPAPTLTAGVHASEGSALRLDGYIGSLCVSCGTVLRIGTADSFWSMPSPAAPIKAISRCLDEIVVD